MADDVSPARAAYLKWLKDEVELWCNKDGFFETDWDYDCLTPDDVLDAYQNFEGEGYAFPRDYLEGKVFMSYNLDEAFYDVLLNDLSRADHEVEEGWYDAQSIWDDLESVGFGGVDVNIDEFLSKTTLRVNVFFATPEEQNHDMGSIVDAFGNSYRAPELDRLSPDDLDNGLSYLINQQGHSVTEVYEALRDCEHENPFIDSVREEITENSSNAMSELVVLIQMDGQQMLDFLDAIERSRDSLVLPKDYATIGIFNQWSGCGGCLAIQLEKDAVLPLSMVREFNIEGQSRVHGSWTVDDVYGLVNSCWCSNFSYRDGVDPHVEEDYELALERAQEDAIRADEFGAQKAGLAAVVENSRDAAAALSGDSVTHQDSQER